MQGLLRYRLRCPPPSRGAAIARHGAAACQHAETGPQRAADLEACELGWHQRAGETAATAPRQRGAESCTLWVFYPLACGALTSLASCASDEEDADDGDEEAAGSDDSGAGSAGQGGAAAGEADEEEAAKRRRTETARRASDGRSKATKDAYKGKIKAWKARESRTYCTASAVCSRHAFPGPERLYRMSLRTCRSLNCLQRSFTL